MKIQIVSDLHMEFGIIKDIYDQMCDCDSDVLVLAGDISSSDAIMEDLNRIQQDSGKIVMFVPGNHEYYGASRKTLDKELSVLHDINKNIYVLLEKDICLGDVCFLGSTGWWDGSGGHLGMSVKHGLNDFRMIYDIMDEGNLDGVAWGRKAQTYLSSRMYWLRRHLPDTKLCVITHHFPHHRSIHPHFAGSPLNVCFYNRWEWMIERYQPELWVHGHTHMSFNYTVSEDDKTKEYKDLKKTQVICNPQGYPKEYAVPKGTIRDYYRNHGMQLTEEDMNIYMTTDNPQYDPQMVYEI